MSLSVREMSENEIDVRINYFHGAGDDELFRLGVDPLKLPSPDKMREDYAASLGLPVHERTFLAIAWMDAENIAGFSTVDQIEFGNRARMHLHIINPDERLSGKGTQWVRHSIDYYFDHLKLKTLICEPNAFNTAPHRTLQKAGFKFQKTYETTPGSINYKQSVTRWINSGN